MKRSHSKVQVVQVVLCVLVGCAVGCSQVHTVAIDSEPASIDVEQLNSELENRIARMRLADGQIIKKARSVKVNADSTFWTDSAGGRQALSNTEVCEIRYADRGKGALRGFMYIGGASTIFFLATGDLSTNSLLTRVGFGAFTGAIYGAAPGFIVGYRTTYRFCSD